MSPVLARSLHYKACRLRKTDKENAMKRIIAIAAVALIAAGSLFAQTRGPRVDGSGPQIQSVETVKVEGKLALVNGFIAVQTKDKTYYVMGIRRLIGFVDGLKEGAAVKLEGEAFELPMAPEYLHLRVTKLTFNGKDYDLSQAFGRGMMGGGRMGCQDGDDWGGMRGGRGNRF
jgi:hypothetical protein